MTKMTAIFISKDNDEFRAYEYALAGISESTGIVIQDLLNENRSANANRSTEPKKGPFELENDAAGACLPDNAQSVALGRRIAFPNDDLYLVVWQGGLLSEKEALRQQPDNSDVFRRFEDEIRRVLNINNVPPSEKLYVFVHLGNAGNASNVAEIEQCLQNSNQELKNGFDSIQCLSSKRSEIFPLGHGMIRLPMSSAEVEELRGRIELSGNVEGFLTAFSLRCATFSDGCEMAPVQWVRSWLTNLPKGELKHAKNWLDDLERRLPEEDADHTVIALAGRLLGYLLLEMSEADEKELDNRLIEVGLRNIAIAVGKVLQKGR